AEEAFDGAGIGNLDGAGVRIDGRARVRGPDTNGRAARLASGLGLDGDRAEVASGLDAGAHIRDPPGVGERDAGVAVGLDAGGREALDVRAGGGGDGDRALAARAVDSDAIAAAGAGQTAARGDRCRTGLVAGEDAVAARADHARPGGRDVD